MDTTAEMDKIDEAVRERERREDDSAMQVRMGRGRSWGRVERQREQIIGSGDRSEGADSLIGT